MSRRAGAVAGLVLLAVAFAGCKSTHDMAAEIVKKQKVIAEPTVVKITANSAITTRVAAILTGTTQDGPVAAVVVELTSQDRSKSVVWAPIDVRLKGADGAVVGESNIDGVDPSLIHVPSLPAGGTAYYVNDQFTPSAPPTTAVVTLGGELRKLTPPPGTLKVTAKIVIDPDYGPQFVGTVTNTTTVRQEQVIVQAIARVGDRIVAAGTSIVKGLAPGASVDVTGGLIGDVKGATLTIFAPVSNVSGAPGAPVAG